MSTRSWVLVLDPVLLQLGRRSLVSVFVVVGRQQGADATVVVVAVRIVVPPARALIELNRVALEDG